MAKSSAETRGPSVEMKGPRVQIHGSGYDDERAGGSKEEVLVAKTPPNGHDGSRRTRVAARKREVLEWKRQVPECK